MSDIYHRIRTRREELGLTQAELAFRMGYKSKSSINKIEMGINDIPQSKVIAFAQALDTTTAYLMGVDEEIKMPTFAESIKALREKHGLSQEALAERVGYKDRSTIAKIEAGLVDLSQSKIAAFAKALSVTPAYLMGITDGSSAPLPSNMNPLGEMQQIPLIGQIACGTPVLAEQNIEDYVDLPRHIRADYALVCKGESMIGAGIHDGDVVYIRKQESVNNGQIAAVLVDGDEATLKRFYYDGTTVTLIAENPAFPPMAFTGKDINRQRVIGLAVAFTHGIE